jgi:hypothetical protein
MSRAKASLEGARMVMFCAAKRVETISGTVWRSAGAERVSKFSEYLGGELTAKGAQIPLICCKNVRKRLRRRKAEREEVQKTHRETDF